MAGVKLLSKIQLGKETTAGTAVAATAVWRGMGVLEDQREVVHVDENVGYLSRVNRTNTPKLQGAISLEGDATFEQLPYILTAGVKAVTSGSADTGGSGYIYTYPFPTTSANTITSFTIEGGDNQQEYEMEYAFIESFTLSGAGGEAVKVSANWIGRQISKDSFTSLSLATVESINFGKGKLYIDAVSGTAGTTQVTNTFLDMKLDVKTGWTPVYTGDGNKYFTFPKNIGPELMLDITFEHDDVGEARWDDFIAETPKQIRMVFEGSALTTAGATYTYKSLIIDMVGKVEKVSPLADKDGNNTVTVTFRGAYDPTCAKFATITVVNQNATLT